MLYWTIFIRVIAPNFMKNTANHVVKTKDENRFNEQLLLLKLS